MTIFPPGLPLVHGPHLSDELAAWAARRIRYMEDGFGPSWAVGVRRGRDLAAVVVYSQFLPSAGTVQVSIAADTPRWASRQVVAALLGAPFAGVLGAPVRVVWAVTASDNPRSARLLKGLGFVREGVLAERFAPGVHAEVARLTRREFQKRYGGG